MKKQILTAFLAVASIASVQQTPEQKRDTAIVSLAASKSTEGEQPYIASVRLKLDELDARLKK